MSGFGTTSKQLPGHLYAGDKVVERHYNTVNLRTKRISKNNLEVRMWIASIGLVGSSAYYNWKMDLQRNSNSSGTGTWSTIGSRTGFVSAGEGEDSPSLRVFTNIRESNSAMRINVRFYNYKNEFVGYMNSKTFYFYPSSGPFPIES